MAAAPNQPSYPSSDDLSALEAGKTPQAGKTESPPHLEDTNLTHEIRSEPKNTSVAASPKPQPSSSSFDDSKTPQPGKTESQAGKWEKLLGSFGLRKGSRSTGEEKERKKKKKKEKNVVKEEEEKEKEKDLLKKVSRFFADKGEEREMKKKKKEEEEEERKKKEEEERKKRKEIAQGKQKLDVENNSQAPNTSRKDESSSHGSSRRRSRGGRPIRTRTPPLTITLTDEFVRVLGLFAEKKEDPANKLSDYLAGYQSLFRSSLTILALFFVLQLTGRCNWAPVPIMIMVKIYFIYWSAIPLQTWMAAIEVLSFLGTRTSPLRRSGAGVCAFFSWIIITGHCGALVYLMTRCSSYVSDGGTHPPPPPPRSFF